MAVNKNFVVKNGLEVDTNLILANADTNKVGIGTTVPRYTLHVHGSAAAVGGIGATNITVSGIGTFENELRVGVGGSIFSVIAGPLGVGQSVGIRTANPSYLLDVRSPVSTGQTALYVQGDVRFTGITTSESTLFGNRLSIAGVSTFVGFSTFNDYVYIQDGLNVIGNGVTATTLNVSGVSTFVGFSTFNDYVYIQDGLNVAGITTINNTTDSVTYSNGAVVIKGGLGVEKSVNIGGNLDVTGNITIGGSFFSLESQDVYISNKDIILGFTTVVTPNDDTANHAGIAIASTEGSPLVPFAASGINTLPDTYKQLMWFRSGTLGFSTDAFAFNYGLAIGTTTMANGVRLAIGSSVTVTDTTVNAVSFVGDGSNLTGLATGLTATVGISSGGTVIGTGITIVDYRMTNGTVTVAVPPETAPGIATVTINPQVSLGLVIALGG
jgi:hypothetical protein